jgi:protein kinase-like protein
VTSTEHHYSQQIDEGALIAGRYRLSRWLGLGAMGEVWAARDERLGRDVAVKLVLGDPSTDPEIADRFTREAIAVARINHPNVALVYDQGEYQRHQFVVMELVTGCNLDELRGGRPMPVGAALAVAVQVARALEAAHEVGVLHRDIKPTNIMISHDGVVKVLDFGITGFLQGAGFTERLTRTGADNLGTAAYTAPERISGRAEDRRSDLYSLGCILYLLLSGLPPFPADDSLTILHRHLHDEPTSLRRWRPELAPQLDQLVLWLLAKDPAARPSSAAIVANRLESLALVYPNADAPGEASLDDLLNATAVHPMLPFEAEPGAGDVTPGSFPGLAGNLGPVPETEATTEFDFAAALGLDLDRGSGRIRERDRDRDRGRDRGRGGTRGGSRAAGGSAGQNADPDGFVRTSRRRLAPSLLLVLSVAGGLALGVVVSKQTSGGGTVSAIGAMPSADAAKPTRAAAMGGASAAPMGGSKNSMNTGGGMNAGSAKPSAPGSGMTGSGAGSNTGTGSGTGTGTGMGTGTGTGTGSMTNPPMASQAPFQGATSNVTPNAPITPYLRYTAVAPGSGGCVTLAPGQFECTIGQSGGAAVFQAASLTRAGTLDMGAQPFYCQSSGAEYTSHNLHNHWWAWTESAQGTWGWVSAVDLTGGADDQPEPGLPYCGT